MSVCLTRSKTYKFWPLYFKIFYYVETNELKSVDYLRGVNQLELKPILEFIYTGQASFYQERMKEFLRVGKEVPELENTLSEESVDDNYLRHNSRGQVKGW